MMWLRALLVSAVLLSLPQLMKKDFKVPPQLNIPFNPEWECPPNGEILAILQQPFTYLAHGNQSTVFSSEDGQYVLKLFRYTRPRFPLIQNLKCWIAKLQGKKGKNDLYTKSVKTFTAAHIACTEAREQTQTVFFHLNLTQNQLPTVSLKNYQLPLDRYRFVLQKKVTPFKETLLAARSKPEEMHQLIDSLVQLLMQRSAMGIRNSDPNLAPNFGFLNGKAVEIDFGNYRKAPQTPTELGSYFTRIEHWLNKNAPEYVDYLKNLRIYTNYPKNREYANTDT